MRINKVQLKNFKRFTDLTLEGIPSEAKLVLLIGANGSGKSSVFDGLDYLEKGIHKPMPNYREINNDEYYKKANGHDSEITISLNEGKHFIKKKNETRSDNLGFGKLLGRSSIRIVPRISNTANVSEILTDADSPVTYIENDRRFINDVSMYIHEVDQALRVPVFSGIQANTVKIFRDFIEPFNASLLNVFGTSEDTTIQLIEFKSATPDSAAQLVFKKGVSKINYALLSHGEKQVLILLLNFIIRRDQYQDAIIFIDEMDCHLNTSLQSRLLEEIVTKWIPGSSQLWTASHALGFIDYARKSEQAAIIDFDNLDFDMPQTILPQRKENLDVYEIAIPKETIAAILSDKKLIVTENKNSALYNLALGEKSYLFLPANNNREVFLTVKGRHNLTGLRDRDYLRDDEIASIKKQLSNLKILRYYSFESYLYHPDNLSELQWEGFDKSEYTQHIRKQKNDVLLKLVGEIGTSRLHYIEFKDCIKNDEDIQPIIDALGSDELNSFYPFFNMKKYFDKTFLNKYKYQQKDLVKTNWFKQQVEAILTS